MVNVHLQASQSCHARHCQKDRLEGEKHRICQHQGLMPVIPAPWETEIGKVELRDLISTSVGWASWYIPVTPATWEAVGGRITVQGGPGKNTMQKNDLNSKTGWECGSVVKCACLACARPGFQPQHLQKKFTTIGFHLSYIATLLPFPYVIYGSLSPA